MSIFCTVVGKEFALYPLAAALIYPSYKLEAAFVAFVVVVVFSLGAKLVRR